MDFLKQPLEKLPTDGLGEKKTRKLEEKETFFLDFVFLGQKILHALSRKKKTIIEIFLRGTSIYLWIKKKSFYQINLLLTQLLFVSTTKRDL